MRSCGMKNAKGDECVLELGHGPDNQDWKYRPHKTAKDDVFTYMQERGKAYRQFGSGAQNLVGNTW
jgi:hypothetical protein